jgi:hypothetical protein
MLRCGGIYADNGFYDSKDDDPHETLLSVALVLAVLLAALEPIAETASLQKALADVQLGLDGVDDCSDPEAEEDVGALSDVVSTVHDDAPEEDDT